MIVRRTHPTARTCDTGTHHGATLHHRAARNIAARTDNGGPARGAATPNGDLDNGTRLSELALQQFVWARDQRCGRCLRQDSPDTPAQIVLVETEGRQARRGDTVVAESIGRSFPSLPIARSGTSGEQIVSPSSLFLAARPVARHTPGSGEVFAHSAAISQAKRSANQCDVQFVPISKSHVSRLNLATFAESINSPFALCGQHRVRLAGASNIYRRSCNFNENSPERRFIPKQSDGLWCRDGDRVRFR